MSIKSVLKSCHSVLRESARAHRQKSDVFHEAQCILEAEAVRTLLADLDNEQQEEEPA